MKTRFLCLICLLLSFSLHASPMYKWIDENGEVVYSDEPPHEGAEQLKPPGLTTTPAIKYKPAPKAEPEKPAAPAYTELRIASPTQDQTFHGAEVNIPVTLVLTPALNTAEGHYLTLEVNGQTIIPKLTATSATVAQADRGSNAIRVHVHDKTGKRLKSSDSVTVFVHRPSLLQPKPR